MKKQPIIQISLDVTTIEEALDLAGAAARAGVDWLEAGTPLETIASVMGHVSPETTRIYTKVDLAALRSAALDPEEVAHA